MRVCGESPPGCAFGGLGDFGMLEEGWEGGVVGGCWWMDGPGAVGGGGEEEEWS